MAIKPIAERKVNTLIIVNNASLMPISWKGTLQHYAGRLHRLLESKKKVQIYDYVDTHVGVLELPEPPFALCFIRHAKLAENMAESHPCSATAVAHALVLAGLTSGGSAPQACDDITSHRL